ncbi:MAG TPA: lysophospholipid acyltransferase family protein [Nitrospiria bacterium]|jgi:1-acyl-sn-glycerol-3-phosphate acyltransferase
MLGDVTNPFSKGPHFFLNLWHFFGLSFWIVLLRIFNHVTILGKENIPKKGERGVLFLYNHISAIDPFVIGVTSMPFFSPVWWKAPAKEELFKNSFLRYLLYSWGAFPVRRGQQDQMAMDSMVQMAKDNVLVIAPEGRRSPTGDLLPGRPGVGRVIHFGKPNKIIPVLLQGTEQVLPKGRFWPRFFRKIIITYGPSLNFSSFDHVPNTKEVSQVIVDEVMNSILVLMKDSG